MKKHLILLVLIAGFLIGLWATLNISEKKESAFLSTVDNNFIVGSEVLCYNDILQKYKSYSDTLLVDNILVRDYQIRKFADSLVDTLSVIAHYKKEDMSLEGFMKWRQLKLEDKHK